MSFFSFLYEFCIKLSKHRRAPFFLCLNSFIESIFWPIPSDVMLAPMCLARRERAFRYAFFTTIFSVAGAVLGYYLGRFLYDPYVRDLIIWLHYESAMVTVRGWFANELGILMVFVGAFTPIPYKVIAITAGVVAAESLAATGSAGMLTLINFIGVSIVGRALRFYLVAGIIYLGGEKMERAIRKYIDWIGWACVVLVAGYIVYKVLG